MLILHLDPAQPLLYKDLLVKLFQGLRGAHIVHERGEDVVSMIRAIGMDLADECDSTFGSNFIRW